MDEMMNEAMETTSTGEILHVNRLRTPKVHALEHATITVLAERYKRLKISGLSTPLGFILFGETSIEEVQNSADIALARLRNGERELAIHKNCGTNLAMAGLIGALGSLIAVSGTKSTKERLARLDFLVLATAAATLFGPGLGLRAQRELTTDPDLSGMEITAIYKGKTGPISYYFVKVEPIRSNG